MKRIRVLYLVNVPAPYMVDYFNELGKLVDLTVIFEKYTSTERDKSWSEYNFEFFKGIVLKGLSTAPDAAFSPSVKKHLKHADKDYDFIFISNMATPTGIMAIRYLRRHHIHYYLESEGGFAKSGKGLKESFKKYVMSGAERYFSTTPVGDKYFLTYGATEDKLVKYPFTSIYEADIASDVADVDEKNRLRLELGVNEPKMILAVGQFIPRKGFDVLMEASTKLSPDVGIYFVGGEPTEEYISYKNDKGLSQVYFVGFKNKEQLAKYYRAADVFVLPTREDIWGLVINEAMAYGLPVITTDMCIAGLELIDNGEDGYIVPVENSEKLAEAIELTLIDELKRCEMGRESLERIQWYTFESMARMHYEFCLGYLK